jgi:hypothetical protein
MPYVVAADILEHAKVSSPSAADTEWAGIVADALEAVIAHRMTGITITADITSELERAALLDGLAAYAERSAPHGIVELGDGTSTARLGRDITRALEPVFYRYAGPGIG